MVCLILELHQSDGQSDQSLLNSLNLLLLVGLWESSLNSHPSLDLKLSSVNLSHHLPGMVVEGWVKNEGLEADLLRDRNLSGSKSKLLNGVCLECTVLGVKGQVDNISLYLLK